MIAALLLAAALLAPLAAGEAVKISAPDIAPTDAMQYAGHLQVRLVAVASDCDLYYTTDGTVPHRVEGSAGDDGHSKLYTQPFFIYEDTNVKALASPRTINRGMDSDVVERNYRVTRSTVPAPQPDKQPGSFRGQVEVLLRAPRGVDSAVVQYIRDADPAVAAADD